MRLTRVRITIRRMMALVAISALLIIAGQWGYERYGRRTTMRVYFIGDLMRPEGQIATSPTAAEFSEQVSLLKSSITPDRWWLGNRSVTPSATNLSLIVGQTEDGHQQVAEWLRQRRERTYSHNQ
jgi:hypothetical protein